MQLLVILPEPLASGPANSGIQRPAASAVGSVGSYAIDENALTLRPGGRAALFVEQLSQLFTELHARGASK
jgi:hypothetical protein